MPELPALPKLPKEFLAERQGQTFILFKGLLHIAHQQGLKAVTTTLIQIPTELNGGVAICHAMVETEKGTFTGLGDANPGNVSRMMAPHLIRLCETRAIARAFRLAVNVGMAALEELGEDVAAAAAEHSGGSWNGHEGSGDAAPRRITPAPATATAAPRTAVASPAAPTRASASPAQHQQHQGQNGGPPATPKQIEVIERMCRASKRTIPDLDRLTRAAASDLISSLIGEQPQHAGAPS